MSTYCVPFRERGPQRIAVIEFLSSPLRDPIIQNARIRVPELIKCKGVVHYTRSGTRTVVDKGDFPVEAGDFLVTAQACASGAKRTIVAGLPSKDHVFVMPDDPEDQFAENAQDFFDLRINTHRYELIIKSLDHLLRIIAFDCDVSSPIRDIFIVTHAMDSGLMFSVDDQDQGNFLSYDDLWDYINRKNRPQMTPRIIRNNATVNIRGCNIGKTLLYLTKVRELFVNRVRVTAPKHINVFGTWTWTFRFPGQEPRITTHRVEFMEYSFKVFSKVRMKKRNALIKLFLSRHFQDIHGNEVSRAQYERWIPKKIHQARVKVRHACVVPIRHQTVNREYRYRYREGYINGVYKFGWKFEGAATVPKGNQNQLNYLRRKCRSSEAMSRADRPFRAYEWFGYKSFDAFWAGLNWSNPRWNDEDKTLSSAGSRHEYELRIPITGPDAATNRLMLNAFFDPGGNQRNRKFLHHDIIETDDRFFGTVP